MCTGSCKQGYVAIVCKHDFIERIIEMLECFSALITLKEIQLCVCQVLEGHYNVLRLEERIKLRILIHRGNCGLNVLCAHNELTEVLLKYFCNLLFDFLHAKSFFKGLAFNNVRRRRLIFRRSRLANRADSLCECIQRHSRDKHYNSQNQRDQPA